MSSLERFLTDWWGPAPAPTAWIGGLPPELAEPFRTLSRWPQAVRCNQLAVEEPGPDGVRIVYVENQGVWLWGVDAAGRVLERENEPDRPWTPVPETIEEFFLHLAVLEACWTSEGLATWPVPRSAVELVAAGLPVLSRGAWAWPTPGHQLWAGSDRLVYCSAEVDPGEPVGPDTSWLLTVAVRDAADLAALRALPIDWDEP